MISLLQPKILTVGLEGKNQALEKLPIQLVKCISGMEAAAYLKREKVESVVTAWNLPDMPDGMFVRRLRAVKRDSACIVIVSSGDKNEEIYARSYGATVVLTDKASDDFLRRAVIETMRLEESCAARENAGSGESRTARSQGIKAGEIESKHGIE